MGGKASKPKPPPVPPPAAVPETPIEAPDDAIKAARRASGYSKTVLTGSLTPKTGKKTLLG
jgi:hypothetical protein